MTNINLEITQRDVARILAELQSDFREERIRSKTICLKSEIETFKKSYALVVQDLKEKIAKTGGIPVALNFKVLNDADLNFWGDYGQFGVTVLVKKGENVGEKKWLNIEHP